MKNDYTTHGNDELAALLQQVCKLYELKLRNTHADAHVQIEKLEKRLEQLEQQVEQLQKGEKEGISGEKNWTSS